MNKYKVIYIVVLIVLFGASTAQGYWIWTPKSGKWENPKHAVQANPEAQYEQAQKFFETGDYKNAIREFRKLIKRYSQSTYAPRAQFQIGGSFEGLDNYYNAFRAYQKVIDIYPYNELVDSVIESQYNIGLMFAEGKRAKLAGLRILPAKDKAIEILTQVVENAPYGKYADKAQYRIGEILKEEERFSEAGDAFSKVVYEHTQSELAEKAKYQLAFCYLKGSRSADYDKSGIEEAIKQFKSYLRKYPNGELAGDAQAALTELEDRKALADYETGKFYQRIKKYASARIYYQGIISEYPNSNYAQESKTRLEEMEGK